MPYLYLNCPKCRERLTYVPLDGLTLYYQCPQHGAVILRPLVPVDDVDEGDGQQPAWHMPTAPHASSLASGDAA